MLRIAGGEVYDPANGVNGEVRDIWIRNGKVVEPPGADPAAAGEPVRTIDARGMIVMPGGIDMHAHIAGPKVNLARKMFPEYHRHGRPIPRAPGRRSGIASVVPSTFATGYLYAGLGYTTAVDAAVIPMGARHTHEEFADTPVIDKMCFIVMGNNEFVLDRLAEGRPERVRDFAAWLLGAVKGAAIKIVNPGGTEAWKFGTNVKVLDEPLAPYGVTPRQIVTELTRAGNELGLPHPVHIHANNLGVPGNWTTTLATMEALSGLRAHLTHIQFHSYGGTDYHDMCSRVPDLVEYFNTHPELTVDVGQVVFGRAATMTADSPWQYLLYRLTGQKWANEDVEVESGCGVVPYEYKDKSYVNTLQWAIGLEWFLLARDPWRIALTTDHPNGGVFMAYPQIIRLLMDREARREAMRQVNQKALRCTHLPELDREYTLYEIAIITRAAPARLLGLRSKGHLGPGADADVTIYSRSSDWEATFSNPRYVIKDGEVVLEDGEIRAGRPGRTFYVDPPYDPDLEGELREHFERFYTIRFENYPVDLHYLPRPERLPASSPAAR